VLLGSLAATGLASVATPASHSEIWLGGRFGLIFERPDFGVFQHNRREAEPWGVHSRPRTMAMGRRAVPLLSRRLPPFERPLMAPGGLQLPSLAGGNRDVHANRDDTQNPIVRFLRLSGGAVFRPNGLI